MKMLIKLFLMLVTPMAMGQVLVDGWTRIDIPDRDLFQSLYGRDLVAAIAQKDAQQTSILIFERAGSIANTHSLELWKNWVFGSFLKPKILVLHSALESFDSDSNAYQAEYQYSGAQDSLFKGFVLAIPHKNKIQLLLYEDQQREFQKHRVEILKVFKAYLDRVAITIDSQNSSN
jgi:hypothetical protein